MDLSRMDLNKVNIRCNSCGNMCKYCKECKAFKCNVCNSKISMKGVVKKKNSGCGCGKK